MESGKARYGLWTIIGGGLLIVGSALLDAGRLTGQPLIEVVGNLLSALAGLPLICLPLGLLASGFLPQSTLARIGTFCWGIGLALLSVVDLPPIVDPASTDPGTLFGPVGLVLLSLGFLIWFAAIRKQRSIQDSWRWLFLVAGLWFFVTFPTIQIPLFVIPNGHPLFILLSGVFGLAMLLMGRVILERPAAVVPRLA